MFVDIEINTFALFNGKVLPEKLSNEHSDVSFYMLVLRQSGVDLFRTPFFRKEPTILTVKLYSPLNVIPVDILQNRNYSRLENTNDDIDVHIYKFRMHENGVLGMQRFIDEYSASQDKKFMSFKINKNVKNSMFVVKWVSSSTQFKPVKILSIDDKKPMTSPIWHTQREFYSKLHSTLNMELLRENCEKTIKFIKTYETHKFENILDFIKIWSKFIKPCVYEPDYSWFNKRNSVDKGDAAIESTKSGDCEDFAHYYVRMFYILTDIYEYVITSTKSTLYINCSRLFKFYKPFVYICKVRLRNRMDYHSTIMMVPKKYTEVTPNISFEVTNTNEHCFVNKNTKFFKLHVEHYFLVDSYHIARLYGLNNNEIEKFDLDGNNIKRFFNY